jgi:hypothetical protein
MPTYRYAAVDKENLVILDDGLPYRSLYDRNAVVYPALEQSSPRIQDWKSYLW